MTSVAAGSLVTLTAQVRLGSAAVAPGQVSFCDATAKTCEDIHLLGTAQLTAEGTAILRLRPGIGSHRYKAMFLGTKVYASSVSGTSALTATGTIPPLATTTGMSETGAWGAYTLSASVTEVGNTASPSGTVSFLDTNHGNAVLGTGTLGPAKRGVAWSNVNTSAPDLAAVSTAVADLNGDGIPDLFFKDYFGTYDVLLGKGDGTFTIGASAFGPYSQTGSFILGDFNQDGIPDVAAINAVTYTPNNTITIFLGNGDGTFTVSSASPAIGANPGGIAAVDINGDGITDLAVSQTDSSGYGQLLVFFGKGDGTFMQTPSMTSIPNTATSVVAADINADGQIDLVLSGNGITILLGKGDGTFTAVKGPAQAGESTASVVDVNNDGFPDLVFEAASTSYLTVALGKGDGTFTAAPASPNATFRIGALAIGDFNQDGSPDIVYALPNTTGVGLLFGNGDGTFVQTSSIASYSYDFSGNVVVADFNGDGWPDVLTVDLGGRTVEDSLTLPTETATASATVSIAASGTHLAQASYSGDANYNTSASSNISLWGDLPSTATSLTITSGGAPVSSVSPHSVVTLTAAVTAGGTPVAAGQVNFCDASAAACSDIHLIGSVALSNSGTAAFKFVPGPGSHSYKAVFVEDGHGHTSSSAAAVLTVGPAPAVVYSDTTAITSSGFPGDYSLTATVTGFGGPAALTGNISFVDTSFSYALLGKMPLGSSTAGIGWLTSLTPATGAVPVSEVTGDFNLDGIPDVAVLWTTSSYGAPYSITILTGMGDGTFRAGPSIPAGVENQIYPYMISGDFNGDGKQDLAILSWNTGNNTSYVTTLLSHGDGTFGAPQTNVAFNQGVVGGDGVPGSMVAADFNGDGKMDVAVVGNYIAPGGIAILLGNGDGTFAPGSTFASTQDFGQIQTGDFNDDKIPDLVVTNYFEFGTSPIIFLGKGDGTFTANTTPLSLDYFPTSIVVGDFNGDGELDLAFSDLNGVEIALGNGDGSFKETSGSPIAVPSELYSLKAGDFNHDGKLDLAGIDNYNDLIVVLIGAGDGTFSPIATTPAVGTDVLGPFAIVSADFNEDGVPDLAMLTKNQATATILLTGQTETATATLANVAPVGTGTHNVKAINTGDKNYPSSLSGTVALTAGLKPVTISPAGGTFSSVQTVTMTEAIPGATIYYQMLGTYSTNGYVQYTGPVALSIGGQETIYAYATETGYDTSAYTTVKFTLNLPVAPVPVISPSAGSYPGPKTVTIADAASTATIYYTTDGTLPTLYSAIYTGPITVSSSGTVAAIAAGGGYSASPAASTQFFIQSSQSRYIYTVAGSGLWGYGGDGGPAPLATLNDPTNTAVDSAGNLYIVDSGNRLVRKVDATTGIITTIAGTGIAGYSGDGGPAIKAQLTSPAAVALDSHGNLFISDSGNYVVRRVDAVTGVISTVAGNGKQGTTGDGGPATNAMLTYPRGIALDAVGNLYIGDQARVRMVNANTAVISTVAGSGMVGSSGDGGPATSATLEAAEGIAIDKSGNLYIADTFNHAIRKVTAGTGIITAVAGQTGQNNYGYSGDGGPATSAKLDAPIGVAVDSAGNLFIADSENFVLREVTAADGKINTISGHSGFCTTLSGDGGPASQAGLCYAVGVTVDSQGNLYLAEESYDRIRKIVPASAPPANTTAQPTFSLTAGTYAAPQTLTIKDATPGAEIYLSINGGQEQTIGAGYSAPINITGSSSIQAVAVAPGFLPSASVSAAYTITALPTAVINTFAGNGAQALTGIGGPAIDAGLAYPSSVASDGAGNVYIADQQNVVVWEVSGTTGNISVAAGIPGMHSNGLVPGPATSTALSYPQQVAVDKSGNLYIADVGLQEVLKVDATTGMMTAFAGGGAYPTLGDGGPATQAYIDPNGIAFDRTGNLYISDEYNQRIREVSATTGIITTVAGGGTNGLGNGGPATSAMLGYPGVIVLDSKSNLFIADSTAFIRRVDAKTGVITAFAGNGNFGASGDGGSATAAEVAPSGLAVDSSDNLYISNSLDGIRMVPAGGGTISRVVGVGYSGFEGDGGSATMAELCGPQGLTFDTAGSLYIADSCNNRVRKVTYLPKAAAPSFTPAAGNYATPQSVSITDATPAAVIYYTTNGSTPTTASARYSAPIPVSAAETIQAIAVATGYSNSPVASAAYTIGALPPAVKFSAASLTFPSTVAGATSGAQTLYITNLSKSAVTFSAFSVSGTNANSFLIVANACGTSLASGVTCSLTVSFKPTTAGSLAANLVVTDNAAGSPQSVPLTGTATNPPLVKFSGSSLTFPSTAVGAASTIQTLYITNIGKPTVSFGSFAITGANASSFLISANTCSTTLASGASCSLSISFKPTGAGTLSANLAATDNATGSPQSIVLSGTATSVAMMKLSTSSLAFSSTTVGSTSAKQTLYITNIGKPIITFGSVAISGANASSFLISANTCTTTLASGASCSLSITLKPSVTGALTGSLTVVDNASGSPQSVALSGSGK